MLRNLFSAPAAGRGKSVSSRLHSTGLRSTAHLSHRAQFEPLESRQLLTATVIEVNTTADVVDDSDAFISLREAIIAANASPNDHEIHLPAGNYVLTRQGASEDAGLTGDLNVHGTGALKILGAGSDTTTIDATGLYVAELESGDRILNLDGATSVTVEGINFTGGHSAITGGAILVGDRAQLSVIGAKFEQNYSDAGGAIYILSGAAGTQISESRFVANHAEYQGGAIVYANPSLVPDSGSLIVVDSEFTDNSAGLGGAIYGYYSPISVVGSAFTGNEARDGGAIYVNGLGVEPSATSMVTIQESVFHANSADAGGAIYNAASSFDIRNSSFTGNIAGSGGGIYSFGATTIEASTFSENEVTGGGGAIATGRRLAITGTSFLSNRANYGGAVQVVGQGSGELYLNRSTFESNLAQFGGAIAASFAGRLYASESEFHDNQATAEGGAVWYANDLGIDRLSAYIVDTRFTENSAPKGGAIFTGLFGMTLVRSTLIGNEADLGGGIYLLGVGPGNFYWPGITILQSTLRENSADQGGAIYNRDSTLHVEGSTLAENVATDGGAIAILLGATTLRNSTFSRNVATNRGGAFFSEGQARSDIRYVTFVLNAAGVRGPVLGGAIHSDGGPLTVVGGFGFENDNLPGDTTPWTSDDFDLNLADNGGPTWTHRILPGSSLIDSYDPSALPSDPYDPLLFDQRGAGYARIAGDGLDDGAYEYGSEFTPGVVGRHIFYNNSSFDRFDAVGNVFDANAIATDKSPYVPDGQTAAYANITNYVRGINGIMVDLAGSHPDVTAADFVFKTGNSNSPESWALAPAPASVVVIPSAGTGGSDRVIITWPDGAIRNTWLEVQVLANANTGLETADVFYWGNKVADSGTGTPAGSFVTTPADSLQVYATATGFAGIDNVRDYDRDRIVGPADALAVFANAASIVRLSLAAPAAATASAVASALAAKSVQPVSAPVAPPLALSEAATAPQRIAVSPRALDLNSRNIALAAIAEAFAAEVEDELLDELLA